MKEKIKKILLFVIFTILVNSLYFLIPWIMIIILASKSNYYHSYFFSGFEYLTGIIFFVQSTILFLYFFKNYSKKILVKISLIMISFYIFFALVPLQQCENYGVEEGDYIHRECDYIGIKRYRIFGSDCLGIRKKCYEFGTEKNCDEVFPVRK